MLVFNFGLLSSYRLEVAFVLTLPHALIPMSLFFLFLFLIVVFDAPRVIQTVACLPVFFSG
jgi:hypothetical protein